MAVKKNPYEINGNELYEKYYSNQAPAYTPPQQYVPYKKQMEAKAQPQTTQTATQPVSLSDLYGQIMNRQKFSYDVGSDPLYQQYKDRYLQQGQNAMRDTMGQAAALTGGYGSSYAQGVGQQAYDRYVQGLTDKIPELYSAAYSRYQDEGNALMQQYALAKDKEDTEYSRAQNAFQKLYSMISSTGYQPTDAELKAAGMTREVANRLRTIALMKNPDLESINGMGMKVNSLQAGVLPETPAYYGGPPAKKEQEESDGTTYSQALRAVNQAWANGATQAEIDAALEATSGLTAEEKRKLLAVKKGGATISQT